MFRRRPNSPGSRPDPESASAKPPRERISDAAWAVRDRVAVRCGPSARAISAAVTPPFERAVFTVQRSLVWPVEDRAGTASRPTRLLAFGAVLLLAVGAGVGGLLWAAPDGHESAAVTRVETVASQPLAVVKATPKAPSGPTLHGAAPVFKPAASAGSPPADSGKSAKSTNETASSHPSTSSAPSSTPSKASSTAAASASSSADKSSTAPGPPAGPAAISVARNFAGAFVLYETGHTDSTVRQSFRESATAELSRSLMRRPPRLPANVTVPQAKVVNVVAAPSHGRDYPVSVSLLRVGITSELRLEMEQLKDKSWQVTNVLG
jgi:hypothetical protein